LVKDEKVRSFLQIFHPAWASSAVSSLGTSRGLLVAWHLLLYNLVPFLTCGGILLSGSIISSNREINFLNVYGPCLDHKDFWTKLSNSGLLLLPRLILVGDLNLTLSFGESWGGSDNLNNLSSFFTSLFLTHKLVDLLPDKLVPTWRNGHSGSDLIEKHLGRFFVVEDLLLDGCLFRSWVEFPFVSDHAPILLSLENSLHPKAFPFKFNHHCLSNFDYNNLVTNLWQKQSYHQEEDIQRRFLWKLKDLKILTKNWLKNQRDREIEDLKLLEMQIKDLLKDFSVDKSL
jgi:hypothetical protein